MPKLKKGAQLAKETRISSQKFRILRVEDRSLNRLVVDTPLLITDARCPDPLL